MGISANQARLMTLTARQHDLELRAQQISAMKMITSLESQQHALDYSNGLNIYNILKSFDKADFCDTFYRVNDDGSFVVSNENDSEAVSGSDFEIEVINKLRAYSGFDIDIDIMTDSDTYLTQLKGAYDGAVAKLSAEEKQLDMELTQINTEHNAVKTEYDAVKSLVSDNTDKSFNVFG